jgi:glycosyltransferase involved in cell wall biosynthesis
VRSSDDNKRALVIFHEATVGGATRSVLRAVPHLLERGWDLRFHVADPSPLADELRAEGWKVSGAERHVGFSLKWLRHEGTAAHKLRTMPGWFASIRRAVGEHRPAVVHCNSLYTLADAVAVRAQRVPVLLHVHEILPATWKGDAARRVIAAAGIEVAAVSQASAEKFAGPGRPVPRIIYESTTLPDAVVPRSNGATPFRVGSVGAVSPRKGTDLYVEAAARVRAQAPEVEFDLVGAAESIHGTWCDDVLRRARDIGIDYRERDDVFARLQSWDALVTPSRYDPFPLVVLEAMASGRPVVGTRVDGIAEQVTAETGVLAEPEDAESLAAAILDLARRSPEERARMGAAGRERVRTRFTPEPQADAIERAYEAAIAGARWGR